MPLVSTCPEPLCGGFLEAENNSWVGPVFVCTRCGRGTLARMPVPAPVVTVDAPESATHSSRRRSLSERDADVLESEIVDAITAAHQALGRRVLRIGQKRAKRAGNSRGAPDLLIRDHSWPRGMMQAQEAKVPGGVFSCVEQEELAQEGSTVVVHSCEESLAAIAAVGKVEKTMRGRLT